MTNEERALQLILSIGEDSRETLEEATRRFAKRYGLDVTEVTSYVEQETFAKEYGVELDVLTTATHMNNPDWQEAILWGAYSWDVL